MAVTVTNEFLQAVQKLLGALERVELVAAPDRIDQFKEALEGVYLQVTLNDSTSLSQLPEVPFIIPDVDRCATDDAGFEAIWNHLSAHGMCDTWGGAESQRVFRLWIKEGQPEEAARFIVFHANRPSA